MTLLTDEKMTNDRRQTADLGEAVGGEDHLIAICGGGPELRGSMNVRTELDEACCLTGDIQVIPRDHFDVNSSVADSVDGGRLSTWDFESGWGCEPTCLRAR